LCFCSGTSRPPRQARSARPSNLIPPPDNPGRGGTSKFIYHPRSPRFKTKLRISYNFAQPGFLAFDLVPSACASSSRPRTPRSAQSPSRRPPLKKGGPRRRSDHLREDLKSVSKPFDSSPSKSWRWFPRDPSAPSAAQAPRGQGRRGPRGRHLGDRMNAQAGHQIGVAETSPRARADPGAGGPIERVGPMLATPLCPGGGSKPKTLRPH